MDNHQGLETDQFPRKWLSPKYAFFPSLINSPVPLLHITLFFPQVGKLLSAGIISWGSSFPQLPSRWLLNFRMTLHFFMVGKEPWKFYQDESVLSCFSLKTTRSLFLPLKILCHNHPLIKDHSPCLPWIRVNSRAWKLDTDRHKTDIPIISFRSRALKECQEAHQLNEVKWMLPFLSVLSLHSSEAC